MTPEKHPAGHELLALLDHELDEAAARQVSDHCARCAGCRAELAALSRLQALLASAPTPELPRTVWPRVAEYRAASDLPLSRAFRWALTVASLVGIALGLQLGPVKLREAPPVLVDNGVVVSSIWGGDADASILATYSIER